MISNMDISAFELINALKSARINPRTCIVRNIVFCAMDKNDGKWKVSKWKVKRKRELEFSYKGSVIDLDTMIEKIKTFLNEDAPYNYILSEVSVHTRIKSIVEE